MLRAEHLTKIFHPPRGKPVTAVHDASFAVEDGEVFGLLGPNGAGKTTLLRMLGTIILPTSGCCWIDDVRSDTAPDEVRKGIGFLSGNTKLYGRLSAAELLRYFGRLYGMDEPGITRRTEELAALLGMADFLHRRCEALSTGQTQKVSIARAILHSPRVLILDEPTLGLDILTSATILDFILAARHAGHSIVFSTHHMEEAERLCDRIGLIHRGELMALGTQADLQSQTGKENLQEIFLTLVAAREPASP